MNTIKRSTLIERFQNAIKAFKGEPAGSINFGIDITRCDECEYKCDESIREHLLVVMGARAAYMDYECRIDIPGGVKGEGELSDFVKKTVESYIQKATDGEGAYFDEYIETALLKQYGTSEGTYEAH